MKKNVFKKKLLCLFLCSVMLVSLALAGCNGNKDNDLSNIDTTAEQTTVVETEEDTRNEAG